MVIKSINQSISHEFTYVGPPIKARLILHKLIPQIPLIWNYENYIHAYVKSRGAEDYLKARAELKLFGRKLDF